MARPSQLPTDIWDFIGRSDEARILGRMLADTSPDSGAVPLAAITGMAGVGKTTLAVRVAHLARLWFPDGQLFADLRGASAVPLAPGEVLARFLRGLGTADDIPPDETGRSALFRTQIAGRRVLIVLDNARDAAQVSPLLPGSSTCAVLLTTRSRIRGLPGALSVDLNPMGDADARELLAGLVGSHRITAEPRATAEILQACAGLPQAIRAAGMRLSERRSWPMAATADRMRNERAILDELEVGELAVRASFEASLHGVPAGGHGIDPARAFCTLALWHSPAISLPAAAALLGEPEDQTGDVLECLADAHLLESPAPGEYEMHCLLRAYAAERAASILPAAEHLAAARRMGDWLNREQNGDAQHMAPATSLSVADPSRAKALNRPAAEEAARAALQAFLEAHGITGREQAAAFFAAVVQTWPEAPGSRSAELSHAQQNAGSQVSPSGIRVIPDAPGYDLRPNPLTAETPADLVRALVQLRQWAGNPPFREMERRCDSQAASSTIYTALASDKLPSQRVVLAIVTACDAEDLKLAFNTAWRKLNLAQGPARRRTRQAAGLRLYSVPVPASDNAAVTTASETALQPARINCNGTAGAAAPAAANSLKAGRPGSGSDFELPSERSHNGQRTRRLERSNPVLPE
jgi:hypothetical protein